MNELMVGSKSTDKLIIIQEIVADLKNSLPEDTIKDIQEIEIGWQSVDTGEDLMAYPCLKIRFHP